eukprot:12936048-Prorocentrum_lima.AAC.1
MGYAKLTPLAKEGGKIRPIAGVSTLRRTAYAALCQAYAPQLAAAVGSHQYGLGHGAALEKLTARLRQKALQSPQDIFTAWDASNAFSA